MMIAALISSVLLILAVLIAIPTTVLCVEIAAVIARRQGLTLPAHATRARIAVIVPAHNESTTIIPTLEDIKAQLRPGDRLLVVADNCTDDTASISRISGAEVVERQDAERIGKGYALDCGLRFLEPDAPDIVVMVDSDCRLAEGSIGRLATDCSMTGRPVQALYLMNVPEGSGINKQIAAFAWRVKNWVRPLGLKILGLPCQLMGTGMAFPWPVIRAVDLASGWIVEDLKLGLDLAAAGYPPLFCPSARVTSQFATSAKGSANQRKRWEQGHIMTIVKIAPRSLYTAIARGSLDLLALTLDLIIPPLSFLAMLLVFMFAITGVAALVGLGSTALIVSAACLVGFATTIGLAWDKYGRDVLPARDLWSVPMYVLAKLGLYGRIFAGRKTAQWIKTDRTKD
jgi:cellulose synthase/poly-beta-1,6-N-acetylglucosamine synthase-like glycosyltransferase